jgi:hypothetical protein
MGSDHCAVLQMSQQRKLARAALRRLGPEYRHATMIVVDRRDGSCAWAVQCTRSGDILLGPRGSFEDEERAWAAGWKEILQRAAC